jgi:hypothetical protein
MKRDDNLQYVYDELNLMDDALDIGVNQIDSQWLNTVIEALRVFADENNYYIVESE